MTAMLCVPTNSVSRMGSPSSNSIVMTSCKFALGVCAGKTRNVADVKVGVRATLNDGGEGSHRERVSGRRWGVNAGQQCGSQAKSYFRDRYVPKCNFGRRTKIIS